MTGTIARLAAASLIICAASTAGAQSYRPRDTYRGDDARYVVAESQWGNGTISGPIRPGRNGWQVRLPRGTWIDCVRSCSDTLRRATIDFWQTNGPNAPGSARGYLHWEFDF